MPVKAFGNGDDISKWWQGNDQGWNNGENSAKLELNPYDDPIKKQVSMVMKLAQIGAKRPGASQHAWIAQKNKDRSTMGFWSVTLGFQP